MTYDIALAISPDVTIARLAEIAQALDDLDVWLNWSTLEVDKDGASIEGQYPDTTEWAELEAGIDAIGGVAVDHDTMAEWIDGTEGSA